MTLAPVFRPPSCTPIHFSSPLSFSQLFCCSLAKPFLMYSQFLLPFIVGLSKLRSWRARAVGKNSVKCFQNATELRNVKCTNAAILAPQLERLLVHPQ
jgi:hypothetical protein